MKKNLFPYIFALSMLNGLNGFAQTQNMAFKFDGTGCIECEELVELNQKDKYTLQCWINPESWQQDSYIFKTENNDTPFALKLGNKGELIYIAGNQSLVISSDNLANNKWSQLTIVQDAEGTHTWINSVKVTDNAAPMNLPDLQGKLVIGENFRGRIDELRFWDTDINKDYLLFQNTINEFHPNYQNLVAYYKGDQKNCVTKVYDSMHNHHAAIKGNVTREVVTDNDRFNYKILTAYTNTSRFFDRKIPKENYQMANDIIVLDIETSNEGEAFLSLPNNDAILTNAEYLEEYNGRKGVMSLKGNQASMNAGLQALNPCDGWYKHKDQYSLLTWIYLEKWTEGAFIFKKEKSEKEGFSVRLGKETENEVIVRLNGTDYIWKQNGKKPFLKTGEWMHLGISTSVASATTDIPGREKQLFRVGFNGKSRFPDVGPSEVLSADLSMYKDVPLLIGENLDAKLDQTSVWHRECNSQYMKKEMEEGMAMPSIGGYLDEVYSACVTTYYQYDIPENPGYDSFSINECIKIIRSAYEGKSGYTIRLGVKGHNGWENTLGNNAKREKLAEQVKKLVDETKVDGVETDMEWAYGDPGVNNYSKFIALLKEKMPNKIISSSPHAVAYNLKDFAINAADRFSFQIYTNRNWFTMDGFKQAYNNFTSKYPKEKIILSYGATTSTGSINGLENGYRSVIQYDPRPDVTDITTPDGNNYMVCSVNQVKERAQFIVDNNLPGLMYWDMGNDLPATDTLALCRAVNYVMSSNVDHLYTDNDLPSSIESHEVDSNELYISQNPVSDNLECTLPGNDVVQAWTIYDLSGRQMMRDANLTSDRIVVDCSTLTSGCYLFAVKGANGKRYTCKIIKE